MPLRRMSRAAEQRFRIGGASAAVRPRTTFLTCRASFRIVPFRLGDMKTLLTLSSYCLNAARQRRSHFALAAITASLLLLVPAAPSQEPKPSLPQKPNELTQSSGDKTPPSMPSATHPLDSADLEAFFDGIIPLQLERSDVAG